MSGVHRSIRSIRVPARFEISADGPVIAVATFVLGLGPCGRTVLSLEIDHDPQGVMITQRHRDGTAATFFYPWPTITGRIEVQRG